MDDTDVAMTPALPPSLEEVRALQQQRFDEANRARAAADAAAAPALAPAPSRKRKAPSEEPSSYTARFSRIHEGKGDGGHYPLRDGSGAPCSFGQPRKSRQPRGG